MFYKKENYLNFRSITDRLIELNNLNMKIDIDKLSKNSISNYEKISEFISTNNIEGDNVNFSTAKKFLRDELNKTQLQKRWIGIKRASEIIWNDKYSFTLEYLKEIHKALLREVDMVGGIWKTRLNQVGSLITTEPKNVAPEMMNLFTSYLSSAMTSGSTIFNIIPMISEFLAIHPFEDGNGRMSRLLMNRELYNAGYKFVKHISLSKFLWKMKNRYISALESRNKSWSSNSLLPSDLIPFFEVILDAMICGAKQAYEITKLNKLGQTYFDNHISTYLYKPMSLEEIVKEMKILNSKNTVSKWLSILVKKQLIEKIGELKSTKYIKIDNNKLL